MIVDRPVVNGVGSVFAVEGIGGPDNLLLQGSRCQKGFEHGTGFKRIRNGPISPGLGPVLKKLIRIERGIDRHGQNLSGRGLHGNGKASLGPPLLNRRGSTRSQRYAGCVCPG